MYIGFASDRDDVQILDYVPYIPAKHTFSVKFSNTLWNRSGGTISGLTDEMVDYINSMYSLEGYTSDSWPSSGGPFNLTINTIPQTYKKT
jgi:hypothetical protein